MIGLTRHSGAERGGAHATFTMRCAPCLRNSGADARTTPETVRSALRHVPKHTGGIHHIGDPLERPY